MTSKDDPMASQASTAFMASMSFATGMTTSSTASNSWFRQHDCCDCGDCESGLLEANHPLLEEFKSERRRQRLEAPITRFQERRLVKRHSNSMSVWKLTMPHNAEPLLEFGSTHRIVYVQRKHTDASLLSIGTGIVGSSDEAKTRRFIDWKQGSAYFVPSNGGKALGWIHTGEGEGYIELYWIKCPVDSIEDESGTDGWIKSMVAMFRRLDKTKTSELNEGDTMVVMATIDELTKQVE